MISNREQMTDKNEGAFSTVSDTDRARQHFRAILDDPLANRSEKANAAKELAQIDHRSGRDDGQAVSQMPRAVLLAEISRARALLSGGAIVTGGNGQ